MSRKNKRKVSLPAITTQNKSISTKEATGKQSLAVKLGLVSIADWIGLIGGMSGIFGVIVAIFVYFEQVKSTKIAEQANTLSHKVYDRSSGVTKANTVIIEAYPPDLKSVPDLLKRDYSGNGSNVLVHLNSYDDLFTLGQYITVENRGDEPVDSVQVSVRYVNGIVLAEKNKPIIKDYKRGYIRNHISTSEYSVKLTAGQKMSIAITKNLLEQIVESINYEYPDLTDYCVFEVFCKSRLLGSSAYDDGSPPQYLRLEYTLNPKGFQPDQCRKEIDKIRHAPVVNYDATIDKKPR